MSADRKQPHKGLDYQGRYEDIAPPPAPRWAVVVTLALAVIAIASAVLVAVGV